MGSVFSALLPQLQPFALQGQTFAAAVLSGTVSDPTGAVIPQATVRLSGPDTASGQQQFTTDAGGFQFHPPPGVYTLQVEAQGFAPFTSRGLHLGSGGQLRIPVHLVIATRTEQIDVGTHGVFTDPGENGSALTFEGDRLNLLSNDPDTLRQQINALAGPGFGGAGPQILVNGFSGGRIPPRSSIRSIRIGQNPYSAFYDSPGFGRVEIDTKPGTDKLHGELDFGGTDQPWDARNPYNHSLEPPFYQFQNDANLTGPLNKKTAFFLAEDIQQLGNSAVTNATVLDPAFVPTALSEATPAPQHTDTFSLRLDRQFGKSNFGYLRDEWSQTHIINSGLGGANPQVLPSSAFNSTLLTDTLQGADTQLLGPHAVNEARFQYLRTRTSQTPNSSAAAVLVEGSFQGGGSTQQVLHDNQDRYELQDRLQFDHGPHALQLGLRFRELRDANTSAMNFNGLYTFNSISAYQVTQQGLAQNLTPAQIRAIGGGASQFNLTTGQPSALLYQDDLGLFAEDDWRIRRGLTFSYGLRLETQSATPDHLDPAPRLGLAWAIRHGKAPIPLVTLRAGYGLFYDRFPAANLLQAIRQNGVSEVAYFLQNPDTYPAIPAPGTLTAAEPTRYRVSPTLHTSYNQIGSLSAERYLGRRGLVSVMGLYGHGAHQYLTRNLNAPLPDSDVRPLGAPENLYQYSSDSNENDEILFVNTQVTLTRTLYVLENYTAQKQRNETDGPNSFPSNQYDLRADYGPVPTAFAQSLNAAMFWRLPFGLVPGMILNARSGSPFNITTGTDLNGDTIFNDRPAFATDLTRTSVVRTALGNFDTLPLAGQTLVPRNSGTGPGLFWMDLQLNKEFHLGRRPPAQAAASSEHGKPVDRPWLLKFQIEAQNLTNRNNPGIPVGVIGLIPCATGVPAGCLPSPSPDFGHALSLATDFSPLTASNRTILLHTFFTF